MPLSITRREMLAVSTVAAMTPALLAESEKKQGWIDAHSHIWPAETDRFPLVKGLTKKDLDPSSFTDEELMALAAPEGVERVVLIQHSVFHLFDNAYLVDAVRRHPQRFRVVGMVDDRAPEPGAAMKQLLAQGVTGFRITPFIRKDSPDKWLDSPGMQEMWKTGAETQQAMCCLINPANLKQVAAMCERHPETPVVIDHFARIGAEGNFPEEELKMLCNLEKQKQVRVKVSAFYALGKKEPPYSELIPMIKRLYETFGPQRLMWASDCPYQLQGKNTYHDSIGLVRDGLDFLSDDDRQWMLRKTAEQAFFYR